MDQFIADVSSSRHAEQASNAFRSMQVIFRNGLSQVVPKRLDDSSAVSSPASTVMVKCFSR
jgi:hypothetical protein